MSKPLPSSQHLRQSELHQKIIEALERKEEKLLAVLESKWVHRYGLSSLPISSSLRFSVKPQINQDEIEVAGVLYEKQEEIAFQAESMLGKVNADQIVNVITPAPLPLQQKISRVAGLINNYLDEVTKPFKKESLGTRDSLEIKDSLKKENESNQSITRPPQPSISHLRRWLIDVEDEEFKAS